MSRAIAFTEIDADDDGPASVVAYLLNVVRREQPVHLPPKSFTPTEAGGAAFLPSFNRSAEIAESART